MMPATSRKTEKTLPDEKNEEQIFSQRGRGQSQMSRIVFTKFTFTKHNASLCTEQQPFPESSSIISLGLRSHMFSVCQTSAVHNMLSIKAPTIARVQSDQTGRLTSGSYH